MAMTRVFGAVCCPERAADALVHAVHRGEDHLPYEGGGSVRVSVVKVNEAAPHVRRAPSGAPVPPVPRSIADTRTHAASTLANYICCKQHREIYLFGKFRVCLLCFARARAY